MPILARNKRGRLRLSKNVRRGLRRIVRQIALFIVAKLPSGERDTRTFGERFRAMFRAIGNEIAAKGEAVRRVPEAARRRGRALSRELRAVVDDWKDDDDDDDD